MSKLLLILVLNGLLAEPAPALDNGLRVNLDARNDSGQNGIATLLPDGRKTRVVIDMSGAPEKVVQPASIHIGGCDRPGQSAKWILKPLRDGRSITVVPASIDTLVKQQAAINIRRGGGRDAPVACGGITG